MKRLSITFIIASLLLCVMPLEAKKIKVKKPDFRKVRWGWTKEDVKGMERAKLVYDKANALGYKIDSVAGKKAILGYYFRDKKLYTAAYSFIEEHINAQLYIEDYALINEKLEKKYGEPDKKDYKWKGNKDLYEDDLGQAVEFGYLQIQYIWFRDRTGIVHDIKGDNMKVSHTIVYTDVESLGKTNDKTDDDL